MLSKNKNAKYPISDFHPDWTVVAVASTTQAEWFFFFFRLSWAVIASSGDKMCCVDALMLRRIFWEAVPVYISFAFCQSQLFLSWSLCDGLKRIFVASYNIVTCYKRYNVYFPLFGKWKTWSLCGNFHKSITAVKMFLLQSLLNVMRWSSWFSSCKFFWYHERGETNSCAQLPVPCSLFGAWTPHWALPSTDKHKTFFFFFYCGGDHDRNMSGVIWEWLRTFQCYSVW